MPSGVIVSDFDPLAQARAQVELYRLDLPLLMDEDRQHDLSCRFSVKVIQGVSSNQQRIRSSEKTSRLTFSLNLIFSADGWVWDPGVPSLATDRLGGRGR